MILLLKYLKAPCLVISLPGSSALWAGSFKCPLCVIVDNQHLIIQNLTANLDSNV